MPSKTSYTSGKADQSHLLNSHIEINYRPVSWDEYQERKGEILSEITEQFPDMKHQIARAVNKIFGKRQRQKMEGKTLVQVSCANPARIDTTGMNPEDFLYGLFSPGYTPFANSTDYNLQFGQVPYDKISNASKATGAYVLIDDDNPHKLELSLASHYMTNVVHSYGRWAFKL